jgi:DNA-binding transcriptional LysR family regulator
MISIVTKARDSRFGASQWLGRRYGGGTAKGKSGRRANHWSTVCDRADGARVELYQIKYFLALCKTLNFARAAERCNVSQPSLTRAVQKLEQEFGGLLIHRERRLTHLTELGELVRPMLEEVVSHSLRTVAAAKRHLSLNKTVLRLGIIPSIGPVRLAPLLVRFAAECFGAELTVVEAPLPRLNNLLLGGDLDVAVMAYVGRPDKRFRYCRLYQERIVAVAPRGHRFEQIEAVRLRDLQNENLLFRTNCDMGDFLLESCRKQGFEPRIVYRSAREDWVQTLVASGFGVTIMPEFSHTGAATTARPLVDPDLVRRLSLVTVAGRRHEPAAALIRTVRTHDWHAENASRDPERPSLMFLSKWNRSMPSADPHAPADE